MKLDSSKIRDLIWTRKQVFSLSLYIMGLYYIQPYGLYQCHWDTNRFKTSFPHTRRLHFLPVRKDGGLNKHYNIRLFTVDSLRILYLTLVRPKRKYASTVGNSIMCTDARKLERIQLNSCSPVSITFLYSRPCYLRGLS
jgi:hypothetical protein